MSYLPGATNSGHRKGKTRSNEALFHGQDVDERMHDVKNCGVVLGCWPADVKKNGLGACHTSKGRTFDMSTSMLVLHSRLQGSLITRKKRKKTVPGANPAARNP